MSAGTVAKGVERRSRRVGSGAHRASTRASQVKRRPLVQRTARAGLCARGLIYAVLAVITADIAASGGRGKRASSTGAIEELVHQPAGPFLVAFLAAGLAAYAGWRWLQAASGDRDLDGAGQVAKRIGWAAIGCVYAGLCARAALALAGRSARGERYRSISGQLLSHPGGWEILTVLGLAVVAGGVGLMVWAVLQKFETYLPDRRMPSWIDGIARVAITYGNVVRGAVFGGMGASLVAAGMTRRPGEAKGFDQVLRALGHHPYGRGMLALAALGFACFAAASALEAAYRRI